MFCFIYIIIILIYQKFDFGFSYHYLFWRNLFIFCFLILFLRSAISLNVWTHKKNVASLLFWLLKTITYNGYYTKDELFSAWAQFHQCSTSSFYTFRSRKRKKAARLNSLFALLVSAGIKATRRTLTKLTPGRDRYFPGVAKRLKFSLLIKILRKIIHQTIFCFTSDLEGLTCITN